MQLEQHFADQMGQLLGPEFPRQLAVAVSGGGDSMVMLHLAAGWARRFGVQLWPVTVDHGLRAESAAEAKLVATEAAGLGLPHDTLNWVWDGHGNLQDAARRGRLAQIDAWRGTCAHVLMAHTQDDQAETVLMRLMRGSGVDGLAGIRAQRRLSGGLQVVRPLLDVRRADLRHYAKVLKIPFADDPSNDDPAFERVRIRQMIAAEGLDVAGLAQTAAAMQRARNVLDLHARHVRCAIQQAAPATDGYAAFDRDGLVAAPAETRLRLVAGALMDIASAPYRPRLSALIETLDKVLSGGKATLHGCLLWAAKGDVVICREFNVINDLTCQTHQIWDRRWALEGPHDPALRVGATGPAGLALCPDWRAAGLPRDVLLSAPAIWRGDALIAAPLVSDKEGWIARIVPRSAAMDVPH